MRWFRFYAEVLNDPKVQTLTGEQFKFWVNVLCVAAQTEGKLPPVKEIAWALRLAEFAATELLDSLIAAGLVEHAEDVLSIHGWKARQYRDDSRERTRRYRERCSNDNVTEENSVTHPVTHPVTDSVTASVSVSDLCSESVVSGKRESERETKSPKVEILSPFDAKVQEIAQRIHDRHPKVRSCNCGISEVRKKLRDIAKQFPANERIGKVDEVDAIHAAWCATEQWMEEGGKFAKGLDNWLAPTKDRWKNPPPQNGHTPRPLSKSERSFGEASAFFSAMNPEYK